MDEMDQADQELRQTIGRIWPFTKRDGKLDLLVPPPQGIFMIYAFISISSYFSLRLIIFLLFIASIFILLQKRDQIN